MSDGKLPLPPSLSQEDVVEQTVSLLAGMVTSDGLDAFLIENEPGEWIVGLLHRWAQREPIDREIVQILAEGTVHESGTLIAQQTIPEARMVVRDGQGVIVEIGGDRGQKVHVDDYLLADGGVFLTTFALHGNRHAENEGQRLSLVEEHVFSGEGPNKDLHGTVLVCKPIKKARVAFFCDGRSAGTHIVEYSPTVQVAKECVRLALQGAQTHS